MVKLPMVRLNLIVPIIKQLHREGVETADILSAQGISRAQVDNTQSFVTAAVMYQLVESLCANSSDPYIAVHTGEILDPLQWRPLSSAAHFARTLHEALLLFAQGAQESASSIEYSIHARPRRTTLYATRPSNYGISLRHNNAFTLSYLLAMMRPIVGSSWNGRHVVLALRDPTALPQNYLRCTQTRSDSLGVSIEFPSDWLQLSVSPNASSPASPSPKTKAVPAVDSLATFRIMVATHLCDKNLNLQMVASLFKISGSTLKRRLAEHGTTVGKEIAQLRKERALELLRKTDVPISSIGEDLGFSSASVFARSLRRWTGHSPGEIRRGTQRRSQHVAGR